mmetsp:Transcript_20845/g.28098  ORF Transcript_20845/g.28098 Transcript_20845/m.28098 type:complete len:82 (+) Transcript_20845:2415-2660(+)
MEIEKPAHGQPPMDASILSSNTNKWPLEEIRSIRSAACQSVKSGPPYPSYPEAQPLMNNTQLTKYHNSKVHQKTPTMPYYN